MSCLTLTTTLPNPCTQCVHPFVYLFEKAAEQINAPGNRQSLLEAIDRVLDKGIVITNCGICCPNCNQHDVYSFASVETQLKIFERLGLTAAVPALPPAGAVAPSFGESGPCCSNVAASVETYLKWNEQVLPSENYDITTCCNGFSECFDKLLCWAQSDSPLGVEVLDRILDKGVAEYGGILNNCTFQIQSELCLLVDLFIQYDIDGGSNAEIIDRILDKGISVHCSESGEITIASVETMIKYLEAIGVGVAVPALPLNTTTTTTI